MKYVIIQSKNCLYPILFPDNICHDSVIPPVSSMNGERIVRSAGFFSIDLGTSKISCFGKSETLKIESRPEEDETIIQNWLDFGESAAMITSATILGS